jgi:RNA 2',3'-cyclic 3'-phosphodiesterase
MVESLPISSKKAFHTALIISPPPILWSQFQKIRQIHDSAYERWMPHINLAFPFVDPNDFDNAYEILQKKFGSLKPFKIIFKDLGVFKHAKKAVLWANPQCENGEIQEIEKGILECLPFCDDLTKKSEDGSFHPHLTLGQFDLKKIDSVLPSFQKKWDPISFLVNEIYLIERSSQTTPFYVKKTIKFGEEESFGEKINEEMKKIEGCNEFYQKSQF